LFHESGTLAVDEEPQRLAALVGDLDEPVLICGHSHIAWQQEANRRLVVNPGSVGAPINGDPRAQYALLTWEADHWQADLRSVSYDVLQIRRAFEHTGLLEEGGSFARACLLGIETGLNVPGDLLLHVRREAGVQDDGAGQVLPDEVWGRAAATFAWHKYRPWSAA
jgi:diadenosine tetraphosphatase ApaH/serine/threonine PP2A family protein phosphatase